MSLRKLARHRTNTTTIWLQHSKIAAQMQLHLPIQMPLNRTITQEWVKISQSNREKSRLTRETTLLLLHNNLRWRDNIFHLINHGHQPLIITREVILKRGMLVWDIVLISKIIKQKHCTMTRNRSLLQLCLLQTQPIFNKGSINVINSSLCLSLNMVLETNKSPMIRRSSKVLTANDTRWLMDKLIKSTYPKEK